MPTSVNCTLLLTFNTKSQWCHTFTCWQWQQMQNITHLMLMIESSVADIAFSTEYQKLYFNIVSWVTTSHSVKHWKALYFCRLLPTLILDQTRNWTAVNHLVMHVNCHFLIMTVYINWSTDHQVQQMRDQYEVDCSLPTTDTEPPSTRQ